MSASMDHLNFIHDLHRDMRLWSEHLHRVAGRLAAVGLDRAAEDIDEVVAEIERMRPGLTRTHTAKVNADLAEAQNFAGEILSALVRNCGSAAP